MIEDDSGHCDLFTVARSILVREKALGFAGPDPYDGLNSRLLRPPFSRSRTVRLAVIQAVKRSPFNLRRILLIPPGLNPKGLALILSGLCDLPGADSDPSSIPFLQDTLIKATRRSDGSPLFPEILEGPGIDGLSVPADAEVGWGYDFPWQGKAFFQPAGFPTVVCTSFVIDSLCDSGSMLAEDLLGASERFVTHSLRRYECDDGVCYSYSPTDGTRVYNASLFAAKILARSCSVCGGDTAALESEASAIADFVVSRQSVDGSWVYGEANYWQWVDNLHTGFILETLMHLRERLGRTDWDEAISRGLEFYSGKLFMADGTALYYPGRPFPADPHCFAQGALTWIAAGRNGFKVHVEPERIVHRAVDLLWDGRNSGFRLIRFRHDPSRTVYSRWSQAWMFRAIAALLKAGRKS